MNANRYRAVIDWFRARPAARRALYLVSRGAVVAVYALYIGLLLWLAAGLQAAFIPMLIVPAAAFLVGSAVRTAIDRPRPYAALGDEPPLFFGGGHRGGGSPLCAARGCGAGGAGGGDRGLAGGDRGALHQRRAGRAGLRRGVRAGGLAAMRGRRADAGAVTDARTKKRQAVRPAVCGLKERQRMKLVRLPLSASGAVMPAALPASMQRRIQDILWPRLRMIWQPSSSRRTCSASLPWTIGQ